MDVNFAGKYARKWAGLLLTNILGALVSKNYLVEKNYKNAFLSILN
jgi:hypothetical protein